MRKIGSCISTTIGSVFLALLLVLFVGPAIYVEVAGVNRRGVVTEKQEPISVRAGVWNRQLLIEVRNQSPETSEEGETAEVGAAQIAVEPALYDQLRVGDTVGLRYVSFPVLNPLNNVGFARLEAQPPLGSLLARSRPLWGIAIGVAVWIGLLMAWSRWRSGWLAGLVGALMLGSGLYFGSGWPPPAPGGQRAAASATVRDLHRVDRVWGGQRTAAEDAVQPYDIVELEFVPAGAAGLVVAVDVVDADSSPGLRKGARLPIDYSVEDHRWAQLDTASRTYYWKNLRTFGIIAAIIVVALLFGWMMARRRAARKASTNS